MARGLRVRLMLSYVFFLTLLLVLVGWFYPQRLRNQLDDQEEATLSAQWDAAKEYFTIDHEQPHCRTPSFGRFMMACEADRKLTPKTG